MMNTTISSSPDQRSEALAAYAILDTPREARFDSITRNLADNLKTPIAYIGFLDKNRLWFKSSVGLPFLEIPISTSLTAKFLNEGATEFVVANLETLPTYSPGVFATDNLGAKSILGRAIVATNGVVIGAVCVIDVVPRVFSDLEIQEVESATTAAFELLELRRVLPVVDEPAAGTASTLGPVIAEESLQDVVVDYMHETLENFDWWAAQSWWYDESELNSGSWITAPHTPTSLRIINNSRFGAAAAAKVVEVYHEPTLVDVAELSWMQNQQDLIALGARHAVVIDVFGSTTPTLRLIFILPALRFFDDNTKKFFAITASLLPKVITRERVRGELQYRAIHDALTGLLNREGLTQWIDDAKSERTSNRVVMFLDLDNFKSINDKYGHAIGDELLIHVASEMSANTRPTDTVARIGGDEFVIVTADTNLELVDKVLAKRVFQALAKPFAMSNGVTWSGAASIGVAAWPAGTDFTRALELADAMMYNAKKAGGGIVFDTKDVNEKPASSSANFDNVVAISKIALSASAEAWGFLVEIDSKLRNPDLDKLAVDMSAALREVKVDNQHLVFQLPKSLWFEPESIPKLLEKLRCSFSETPFAVVLNGNGASADAKALARNLRLNGIARTVLSGFGSGNKEFELLQGIQPVALVLDSDLVSSVVLSKENHLSVRAVTAICEALDIRSIAPKSTTPEAFAILNLLGCNKQIFNLNQEQ